MEFLYKIFCLFSVIILKIGHRTFKFRAGSALRQGIPLFCALAFGSGRGVTPPSVTKSVRDFPLSQKSKIFDSSPKGRAKPTVSNIHFKFQFIALFDRRNRLPNYHVIANQCAHWCGNPVDIRTVLGETSQNPRDCHASDIGHWLAMTRKMESACVMTVF